jgi:hypothetical protein
VLLWGCLEDVVTGGDHCRPQSCKGKPTGEVEGQVREGWNFLLVVSGGSGGNVCGGAVEVCGGGLEASGCCCG